MTDIFREVEEDVRRERAAKLWKAWGNYIIAGALLVLAGVGGWQLWQRHVQQEREAASAQFIAAQRISNPQAAASAMSDIAKTAPKGYAEVARLSEAGAMLASGQRDNAIALYKDIAAQDSGPVGAVARLRAAWALVDSAQRSQVEELLAPLNQPGNAWRENAMEILAYADYRAMNMKAARALYAELAVDPQAPDALRARAKAMASFLATGGAVNYGSVPADVVPAPPQAQAQAPVQAQAAPTAPAAP